MNNKNQQLITLDKSFRILYKLVIDGTNAYTAPKSSGLQGGSMQKSNERQQNNNNSSYFVYPSTPKVRTNRLYYL